MERNSSMYRTHLKILKQELVPATGCTEPIAIAYASAKAREVLGANPDHIVIVVSGSIVKNAKSVLIPNMERHKGIASAVAAGIVAGQPDKMLEVISEISDTQRKSIIDCSLNCPIDINITDGKHPFEIEITEYHNSSYAKVHIVGGHTNIVSIVKDGRVLFDQLVEENVGVSNEEYEILTVASIIDFAEAVNMVDIDSMIGQQILYNTQISNEGLTRTYGANIGRTILSLNDSNDIRVRAKAKAAAGADARMGGSELPVIIVAGSGNQGITASVPVIEYAKELNISKEELFRALVVSNLITVHQKYPIGKLSAFCGAVSAGIGCGSGIAYLHGGRYKEISHTIVNALAILPGMICDGAKPSCAAKIAASVDAGIFGYEMFIQGQEFYSGDGLVASNVEATIANIGQLGKEGMRETDREILEIMVE